MSKSNSDTTYTGIGLPTLLGVLFVGLKLTGHIDWSWWWVLAPLWAPIAIVLTVLALVAVYFGVAALIKAARAR